MNHLLHQAKHSYILLRHDAYVFYAYALCCSTMLWFQEVVNHNRSNSVERVHPLRRVPNQIRRKWPGIQYLLEFCMNTKNKNGSLTEGIVAEHTRFQLRIIEWANRLRQSLSFVVSSQRWKRGVASNSMNWNISPVFVLLEDIVLEKIWNRGARKIVQIF